MTDASMPERGAWHFPHMCRDGHDIIGFRSDDERCPVCIERDRADTSEARLAEAEKSWAWERDNLCGLRAENAQLRADLAALAPLAWWGIQEADGVMPEAQGTLTENTIAAARAVLDRREKEAP